MALSIWYDKNILKMYTNNCKFDFFYRTMKLIISIDIIIYFYKSKKLKSDNIRHYKMINYVVKWHYFNILILITKNDVFILRIILHHLVIYLLTGLKITCIQAKIIVNLF